MINPGDGDYSLEDMNMIDVAVTYPVVTLQCDSLRVEDEVEEKQKSEDRIISREDRERAVLAIIGHKHPATKDGQSGHGI